MRIAILASLLYVIVLFVNQRVQIQQKEKKVEALILQVQRQMIKNENLKQSLNEQKNEKKKDEQIEKIARDALGLTKSSDRVFINIKGD